MTIHSAMVFGRRPGARPPEYASGAELPTLGDGLVWIDASDASPEEFAALELAYELAAPAVVQLRAGPVVPLVGEQADRLLLSLPSHKPIGKSGEKGSVILLGPGYIISVAYDCRQGHRRSRDRIERLEPSSVTVDDIVRSLLAPVVADLDDTLGIVEDRVVSLGRSAMTPSSYQSEEAARTRRDLDLVLTTLDRMAFFLERISSTRSPAAHQESLERAFSDRVDVLLTLTDHLLATVEAAEQYRESRGTQDRRRRVWLATGLIGSISALFLIRLTLPDHVDRSLAVLLAVTFFAARAVLALCLASILFRYVSNCPTPGISVPRRYRSRR